jgi:hypothetical protein
MTISGSSSPNLVAKRESRDLPSWGSVPLQSSELRLHPLAPSPTRPLQEGAEPFESLAGFASRGVLAPTDTSTPGAPSSSATRLLAEARVGRGSPNPRRCRPQGSCPSRRFWLARGSLEAFWAPPFAVAPDALRPYSMPLASLERPFRAFPSREAVPALAGLHAPLRVRVRLPPAQCLQELRGRFRLSSQLFADRTHPEVDP